MKLDGGKKKMLRERTSSEIHFFVHSVSGGCFFGDVICRFVSNNYLRLRGKRENRKDIARTGFASTVRNHCWIQDRYPPLTCHNWKHGPSMGFIELDTASHSHYRCVSLTRSKVRALKPQQH